MADGTTSGVFLLRLKVNAMLTYFCAAVVAFLHAGRNSGQDGLFASGLVAAVGVGLGHVF